MVAAYAAEVGAFYIETSAKNDLNVQDIFIQLSKYMHSLSIDTYAQLIMLIISYLLH